jgi:hypothetical protein
MEPQHLHAHIGEPKKMLDGLKSPSTSHDGNTPPRKWMRSNMRSSDTIAREAHNACANVKLEQAKI